MRFGFSADQIEPGEVFPYWDPLEPGEIRRYYGVQVIDYLQSETRFVKNVVPRVLSSQSHSAGRG